MEKRFFKTASITLLLVLISCNSKNLPENKDMNNVIELMYQVKPLQDTIKSISKFRKEEISLYSLTFSEDSINYNFDLSLRDKYYLSDKYGYEIVRNQNMFILVGGKFKKNHLSPEKDSLIRYFEDTGKIIFNKDEPASRNPYIHFLVKKDNLKNVKVYEGW